MLDILGDRRVALGRELTKAHEELVVRPISGHLSAIKEPIGEYTLVVSPSETDSAPPDIPQDAVVAAEFGELTKNMGLGRKEAMRELGKKYGLPTGHIYDTLERLKHSVD
jgi:16S rRNA (cytidine1402-2'-O)-methyltransferase